MSEERNTEILDEEIEEVEVDPRDKFKEEVFQNMKLALIEEKRLLGRFNEFCEDHTNFEYDEMGMNMEEAEDILRKTDKIRDKFLGTIEEKLLYIFENTDTNTLTRIITFDLDAKEFQYKAIIEVFDDSFNLEII